MSNFIPLTGEALIFNRNQVKVGDGITPLEDLPLTTPSASLLEALNDYTNFYPETLGLIADFEDKTFTRIGDAIGLSPGADFSSKTFYGNIRRCNMNDNGQVTAYYGDTNYTEDGSNGQVMVEIPKFYYRVTADKVEESAHGKILRTVRYQVSASKQIGFKLHPIFINNKQNEVDKAYISAYEGSVYDTSSASYLIHDEQVMNTATDKLSSIANAKPASGITQTYTRSNANQLAGNRGAGWHVMDIQDISAIQLLLIIEYGTCNGQSALGNGIVSITDNSSYSCSSLTGSTSSLGNNSGAASSTTNEINGTQTNYTYNGKVAISWRGIENPWGNIYDHIMGLTLVGNGAQAGGKPYVCNDRNYVEFTSASSIATNYKGLGFNVSNSSNYVTSFGYDEEFDWVFLPIECSGGNSQLPVGDYFYSTANLNGLRTALFGGTWRAGGSYAGLFLWSLSSGVGNRHRSIGARAAFTPVS